MVGQEFEELSELSPASGRGEVARSGSAHSSWLAALLLGAALAGCGTASIQANRSVDFEEYDDPTMLALSPDAFADRLGEPDEWRQEGEGAKLRMVAVWKCLDGDRREIVWRRQVGENGREYWNVVRDETGDGDCD